MVAAMLLRRALGLLRLRSGLLACAPLAAALLAGSGCGGSPSRPTTARPARGVKTPAASQPRASEGPPLLPAQVLAKLDSEDTTPYFARRGDEALLLHAAGGKWWTRRIGADGAPMGAAESAGPAPADAPVGTLRAVTSGYLAAWIENDGGNHTIKVLSLDAAGKATGPAAMVLQAAEDLTWLDVLPNAKGALVIWETPREERLDVMASAVIDGKPSAPALIARDALGWQAAATARGAAVAIVSRPAGGGEKKAKKGDADAGDAKLGQVALLEVDAAGKVESRVVVSASPTAQVDVEIALVGGRYVVAWTDERDIDASVQIATLEPGGKLSSAPRRATAPSGEQALVSLVAAPYGPVGAGGKPGAGAGGATPAPAPSRALIAWEDLSRAPQEGRLIHLATVGPDGAFGADRTGLIFSASGPPDIAADGDGFAAVTLAPAQQASAAPGADAPIWPTFVRFGPDLTVRAAEPVRAAPFAATDGVPYLVRGLTCHAGVCTTLASAAGAESGPGAPLALVSLPVRASAWRAPAIREQVNARPRATAVTALYDGDHLARVAGAELGNGRSLAAWVTYYLEGSSDAGAKGKDLAATLAVRAVGPDGLGKTTVLSDKAWSLGGVALATAPGEATGAGARKGAKPAAGVGQPPGAASDADPYSVASPDRPAAPAPPDPQVLLAWVARERAEAQVYVTTLNAAGEKIAQKKLTVVPRRKREGVPNEASDVAAAYDGSDGWIVAWVDTRDGNAEVYAARVDRKLQKSVPDRRITDAAGDAAEVQILPRGKEIWLVWSDSRQGGEEGNGDIYLARLDAKTLQKLAPEARLFASPEHSRSPSIAPAGTGMVVAWIEEPAGEAGGTAGTVRLARVDEKGLLLGAPALLPAPGGAAASSAAIACDKACRGVITSASNDALSLGAFEFTPGGAVSAVKPLGTLTGSSAQDVSPTLAGASATTLFFADDAISGSGRVRWMTIAWP